MNLDLAHTTDAAGGSVGLMLTGADAARAIGTYTAVLHRAKGQHEREYLRMHEHAIDLERRAAARRRAFGPFTPLGRFAGRDLLAEADSTRADMRALMEIERDDLIAPNLITTVGKNNILDNALAGSAYTAAWYMGLISSTSYSAIAAADTMASHAGWLEAGSANTPVYSESARRTTAWSSASSGSKALSAGLVFTFTGSGTVKGCFLNSVATKDGTTGTLLSAGLFTGGDQAVVNTNTLTVSWQASLT